MSQIRQDYLTEEIVAVSEARALRPSLFKNAQIYMEHGDCPFCMCNNHMLPSLVYESACGNVRIVPNLYPAVSPDSPAYGYHEVIIDTPIHEKKLRDFTSADFGALFDGLRERAVYYYANPRIKFVQIFKNEGRSAGASISHSHWQLLALDFVPPIPKRVRRNLDVYTNSTGNCFLCDLLLSPGLLKVYENSCFISYCPYASPYSYMQNIVPKEHVCDFTQFDRKALTSLGSMLSTILTALNTVREGINVNICFFPATPDSHFFIQVIPRIGTHAGLEIGAGLHIASVYPEKACEQLKKVIAKQER